MASEAVKRQRAVRRRMFGRTMLACTALFAAIFVLMAGQMVLGRDPALGAGKGAPAQVAQRPAPPRDLKAVAGQAVGAVVSSVISDAGEGDDESRGTPAAASPAPAQTSAPAPVQTGAS